ncbi:carboxypeptidase-like regulatory domain-containing protein [Pedobacter helvus]|uniref:Carboxypeptidase-like regulatory domain-containing protein n=1 Tax=Pedobacter helvus TaxID=2563444 RepID=A0ABW9JG13_9SPHI|nr:carboxypeptidase-like regulatory domain-containing protein [Pedobacter ureilyticus]
MKKVLFMLIFMSVSTIAVLAQKQIKGKVKDDKAKPLPSVMVSLKDKEGSTLGFARTNEKGDFTINTDENGADLNLEFSILGFGKKTINLLDFAKTNEISLAESEINLKTVEVKNRPRLSSNGDTLNYKTSDFSDKQDRNIGDVLKKMPGIEVAENGKISYNGKNISNMYIDGDNLLEDKYGIGTKSIPHGAVDKVQVIEKDQPIKMLQKNNTSDDVALNLVIKDDAKLKVMGEVKAGLGAPDRFDGNVNAMLFNKKVKFLNNLKGNNIGIDPGLDLTSFNPLANDNTKPGNLLSAGAAGVPTLPQSRTLFNKAGQANLNNLFKFKNDLQLRANVSYLYDERKQVYNKFSETRLAGQTINYQENQDNFLNPQKLKGQFTLNGNTDGYYFNNALAVEYNPTRTNSNVFINGVGAFQSLKQDMFSLSNDLGYRKKLKSGNILHLSSSISRSSQPETLNIKPGLNEEILNNGTPYAALNQYLDLPTFYTNNFASMAFPKGNFVQNYRAGFLIQQQNLSTNLTKLQNNGSSELAAAGAINDLDWLRSRLYIENGYEYTTDKITATIRIPLSYNSISYDDANHNMDKSLNRFFVNPMVSFKYQTSPENYVNAAYSFRNNLGTIDDVFSGTVLRNYRSLFANNAPVSENSSHSFSGSFNFRKAIEMIFGNISLNYSTTNLNTISSSILTDNTQQRIVLPLANQARNFGLNSGLSKYLFALKSTVNAGFAYSHSQFQQLQNNQLLPFESDNFTYKAGIEAKLTKFMNFTYLGTFTNSKNKTAGTGISTNYQQLRQQSGLAVTMLKSVFLNFSAEHIFTQQSSQPDLKYLFADFNIRYKVLKLKTDLEFGITNLANVKQFEAINVTANSLTVGTYQIPGRVAMFRATFNY